MYHIAKLDLARLETLKMTRIGNDIAATYNNLGSSYTAIIAYWLRWLLGRDLHLLLEALSERDLQQLSQLAVKVVNVYAQTRNSRFDPPEQSRLLASVALIHATRADRVIAKIRKKQPLLLESRTQGDAS